MSVVSPIDIARRELAAGVREATGQNDGVPAERYNDGERKPWCASFVRYCFEEAGLRLPGNRHRLPSVAYMEEQLETAGARVAEPAPGAIITFRARVGSDAGPGRHVGLVEAVDGLTITTIEGNSGNAVRRRTYRQWRSDPTIAGFFVWPLPTRRAA